MDATFTQALDQALQLAEEAVQVGLTYSTKAADLERQLVGEKVLLEKVAGLESRLKATILPDAKLVRHALTKLATAMGGPPEEFSKLASALDTDPNAALQLLVKLAETMPRMRALNEGQGAGKRTDEYDGRWV